SPADNADNFEIGDEILEVNGRTLENASHDDVINHIHQCIKSRTICLRVKRKTGNKVEALDGLSAEGIRDAWVIAVEKNARERLEKLTSLRRIRARDIQAILHQQITEGSGAASTSKGPASKDAASSQITVTLPDKDPGVTNYAYLSKQSNGTGPAPGVSRDSQDQRTILEKQQSCPEDQDHIASLQVGDSARASERRSSSPFQNGRTEVLIGEPEGGPRSPRGSTSSATNDASVGFLNAPEDYTEPIL
ncbi:hypothetical protein QAD02_024439, partial [Eretmocerus hayati]